MFSRSTWTRSWKSSVIAFKVDSEGEDTVVAIRKFKKRIERLNTWWGAKMLGEVNGEACRSYRKKRRNRGGARRDLEDLRAAIGHHAAEGYHTAKSSRSRSRKKVSRVTNG